MKQTTPSAMPPCFEKWCSRFDDVFSNLAHSFIIWQPLTGGLKRRWANKPINTFTEALSAFRTAISYRFVGCLQENKDVFALHLKRLGLIWA